MTVLVAKLVTYWRYETGIWEVLGRRVALSLHYPNCGERLH